MSAQVTRSANYLWGDWSGMPEGGIDGGINYEIPWSVAQKP
jgi:hypothetical protein